EPQRVAGGVALGHEQAEHLVGAESLDAERSDDRAVDAAGNADHRAAAAEVAQHLLAQQAGDALDFGGSIDLENALVEHDQEVMGWGRSRAQRRRGARSLPPAPAGVSPRKRIHPSPSRRLKNASPAPSAPISSGLRACATTEALGTRTKQCRRLSARAKRGSIRPSMALAPRRTACSKRCAS